MKRTDPNMAPWVIEHWLSYWFSVRHTGTKGHTSEQARRHVRRYLELARAVR